MNEIREMINISYFDNKNTTLKEHCDIYSNIKKEVLDILNKYDIKYVVAETEAVKDLVKENQQLKEQLEASKKARKILKEINEYRKETGGYPSEMLDKLLDILNIDKGE